MRSNLIFKIAAVIVFVAYITAFNYGGCGDIGGSSGNSGSSGTPTATAPTQVTSPTLADSATNVITTTQLSWASASGATSYDVFFGTTSPGTFVGNQSGTNYNPGTALSYNTTYYWRIDSKNSVGTTTGNVWTFITQIAPSAQATSPSPANNTINAPINQQLWWASASGATSYDIYFGISSPGTFIGNQTGTSYNPETLSNNTTYYWRIDSKNSAGTTSGSVWNFTTQLPPVAPSSLSATITSSSQINLSWDDNSNNEDSFKIERKTGSGGTYTQIATVSANVTFYPNTGLSENTTYYYRVRAYSTGGDSIYSDEVSAITLLNAPSNITAIVISSTAIALTWTDNSNYEDGYKIEQKIGITGTYAQLIIVTANTVVYTDTGLTINTVYYYRVRAYNSTGDSVYSNEAFGDTARWTQVACGPNHTIGLKTNGTFYAWGWNYSGQLGDGTTTQKTTPTFISGGWSGAAIAAGSLHTIGLKADGTLYAWGWNDYGQLGDGTTISRTTPTRIGTENNWSAIAAGHSHTIALKTDGTLWVWGDNTYGQLGDGTTTDKTTPTFISGGWSAIAASSDHTIGLKPDGTLYAWGRNDYGQLGDGTNVSKTTPTFISGGWTAIAVDGEHTIGLKPDGTLYAWGRNDYGQLGDGTNVSKTTPTFISGGWTAIAAGEWHTIGLKPDGTLYAWGRNGNGQLGDGTNVSKATPTFISGGWIAIAAGGGHTIGFKADGTLYAWGLNWYGQLGDGTSGYGTDKNTPTQVGQ